MGAIIANIPENTKPTIVDQCFNYGDVYSQTRCASGIVGYCESDGLSIQDTGNYGHIVAQSHYAAGILSHTKKSVGIKGCYNVGTIETWGTSTDGGGYATGIAIGYEANSYIYICITHIIRDGL